LYDRIGFAQQYDIAFGDHGALSRGLNDRLLVGLDDRVHLRTITTAVISDDDDNSDGNGDDVPT